MTRLSLTLLGDVACELDGRPVRFARRSGLGLAVYLACAGRAQSRPALAALVGGAGDEASAAMALRNALRDLRAVFGAHLAVDARTVALAPAVALTTDVARFEASARAALGRQSLALLREADAGYGGEFAPGLALKGAPAFDEWLQGERERLRDLWLQVLEQLAAAEERADDRQGAIATTRRLLAEEPWREEAHRRLMRLLARDGQRAAALLQFAQCREILQRELGAAPQPETAALYRQLQGGPAAPPHNLPARATTFIDRPAERAHLAEQLLHPGCRLVTIAGIGGAGKSSLALELAAALVRPGLPDELAFPDGVFLITCDPAADTSARRLALALLRILNLPVQADAEPEAALLRWLAPRRALLLIDNAEAEPAAAAFVAAVLAAAPHVRLLVTSRVRLQLPAEWVFDVEGLTLPSGAEDLAQSEAGQLFLDRARAVRLRAPPGAADQGHIARICRLVHGLPLGIVLAAGRLRALSCAEIAAQLEHDLGLLVSDSADLPERQRNLAAVLRWSYGQLRPDEARCLRLLAVLRGPFDRPAAEAVGCGSQPVLAALVDYGLVGWSGERYSLHPLVQRIAAQELAGSPEEQAGAEERHAAHFAQLAAGWSEQLGRDEALLQALTGQWENLLAAWRWAVGGRRRTLIALLRPVLARAWDALGLFHEAIAACAEAAAALGRGAPPAALAPPAAAEVAELILTAAWHHSRLAESDRALALMAEARRFAERAGDELLLERIERQQGMQLYLQTRYGAARPLLERALALATGRGDGRTELEMLGELARLAHRAGDPALMRAVLAAAENRFGGLAGSVALGYVRFAAAHLAVDLHADVAPGYALLAQHGRAAPVEHHQLRYWRISLEWHLAYAEGRLAYAEELMRPGLERAIELRNGFVPTMARLHISDAVLAQGGAAEADQLYQEALQRGRALGAPLLTCLALLGLARVAELQGERERAVALADEAARLAHEQGIPRLLPRAYVVQGHALAALGRHAEAAERFTEAFARDMAFGHGPRAAAAAVALAAVRHAQGDLSGALQLIAPQLPALLDGAFTGVDEPVRTLLSAAETLGAAGDPRAERLAERAHAELDRRGELVRPERRDAFRYGIPAHQALLSRARLAPR
jgi:DNA-binding SARP family transcriptional activator/predicted ATPase/tetratricopeptide (TPR) repeat protein